MGGGNGKLISLKEILDHPDRFLATSIPEILGARVVPMASLDGYLLARALGHSDKKIEAALKRRGRTPAELNTMCNQRYRHSIGPATNEIKAYLSSDHRPSNGDSVFVPSEAKEGIRYRLNIPEEHRRNTLFSQSRSFGYLGFGDFFIHDDGE